MPYSLYFPLCAVLAAGSLTEVRAQAAPEPAPSARALRPARPSYLRASLGSTSTLNWSYPCLRLAIEYAPMLTRHLGVAARLAGVAGRPTASSALYGPWITDVPNQNYRAGFLEAEGLLYPLGVTHRVRFAVGAGGFVGHYQLNTISGALVSSNQVQNYELATYAGNRAGYLFSLNLEVALGKQRAWLVGLKATRQQGLGGITNLPGQSLTVARQL